MVIASLFFVGCESYQYISVDSLLPHNDQYEYMNENDTVSVTYRFSGFNCPITIVVYNKLSCPIYIDWSKSALIIDDQRNSYWKDEASFRSNSSSYEVHWTDNLNTAYTEMGGTIQRQEQISFIPPHSEITQIRINLNSSFILLDPKNGIRNSSDAGRTYLFDKDNTPLNFRSFLTLSVGQDFSSPIYMDDKFWVSSVLQTTYGPTNFPYKPANQFYLSKTTDFGKAAGWITALALLGFLGYYGQ